MRDPLDHDGDGRKGGSLPRKRGRPPKAAAVDVVPPVKAVGALTVKKADAIFDGNGGFFPVGHKFNAVDEATAEVLKARGLAE